MDGREFIRRARRYARRSRLEFRFDASRGKGSHGILYLRDLRTVVQHGEIDLKTLNGMLRDLDINRREF